MSDTATLYCTHCGAALTEAEREHDAQPGNFPRLGFCTACWDSWGVMVFGWQAGVIAEKRVTYTQAQEQWKSRENLYRKTPDFPTKGQTISGPHVLMDRSVREPPDLESFIRVEVSPVLALVTMEEGGRHHAILWDIINPTEEQIQATHAFAKRIRAAIMRFMEQNGYIP